MTSRDFRFTESQRQRLADCLAPYRVRLDEDRAAFLVDRLERHAPDILAYREVRTSLRFASKRIRSWQTIAKQAERLAQNLKSIEGTEAEEISSLNAADSLVELLATSPEKTNRECDDIPDLRVRLTTLSEKCKTAASKLRVREEAERRPPRRPEDYEDPEEYYREDREPDPPDAPRASTTPSLGGWPSDYLIAEVVHRVFEAATGQDAAYTEGGACHTLMREYCRCLRLDPPGAGVLRVALEEAKKRKRRERRRESQIRTRFPGRAVDIDES